MNLDGTTTPGLRRLADLAAYLFIGLALLLTAACTPPPQESLVVIEGQTMGTTYQVKVIAVDVDAGALKSTIDARLRAVNAVFSTYIPDSEISRINQRVDATPIRLSEDMLALLELSQELHSLSGGAFDVTIGPLVNLWGFGPDGPRNGIPSEEQIETALGEVGFDRVSIEGAELVAPPGLYIDLSAIAKGFGVDEISRLLGGQGYQRYMVEIGGEVRANGVNMAGKAWRIGIETPDRTTRRLQQVLPLLDMGMATSGDYRNFFTHEGRHFAHTLDPRTGWPVEHAMASVTVLHPSTTYADAIATAFSVLGPEQTMAIAQAQNLPVFVILRADDGYLEQRSPALERYLEMVSENEGK